jgi:hypothetical protein
MNNKLIFLLIVLGLLIGLIFIIGGNRKAREETRKEEIKIAARKQYVQDSLQNIRANNDKIVTGVARETVINKGGSNTKAQSEDFNSYINSSITNSSSNTSVAVTIVDENGNIASSISSSIANIYNQTGNNGITGLLRSSFINKSGFQELFEGNSEIIYKLKLDTHTDYLVLGKVQYSMRKGTLVEGTSICTASISVSIISANSKTIFKGFNFSVNGNGSTDSQAEEKATQQLLSKYKSEYSSL